MADRGGPGRLRDVGARAVELRELIEYHNERYHELDAPGDPRRRLRRPGPRAAPARGGTPELRHGGLADAAVGAPRRRDCSPRSGTGSPMMSLDNAFDEAELRRLGRPAPPAPARCRPRRAGVLLRAEGRRRRHVAHLRRRPADAGRHPRRRRHRRGRHGQRGDRARRAARARPGGRAVPAAPRGARRDLHADGRLRRARTSGPVAAGTRRSSTPATRPPGRCGRRTRR